MEHKTENEKKKEYLWRYRKALRKEQELEGEIRELRLSKIAPGLAQDGMPHGSGGGDLSGYMAKLDELITELSDQVERRINFRLEISRKIEEMEDETESLLLRYRYIQGLKWEDIAVRMDYSWQHMHKLHAKALTNLKI